MKMIEMMMMLMLMLSSRMSWLNRASFGTAGSGQWLWLGWEGKNEGRSKMMQEAEKLRKKHRVASLPHLAEFSFMFFWFCYGRNKAVG